MADWLAQFFPHAAGDLEKLVHELQAALERADVRNAVLQNMLDQAVERAEAAEEDLKAATAALRWARGYARPGGDEQLFESQRDKGQRRGWRKRKAVDKPKEGLPVLAPQQASPGMQSSQQTSPGLTSSPTSASSLSPLNAFRKVLADVLRMREDGAYDSDLMRQYGEALVVLPDADLREAYAMFTRVYTHEHDSEVLQWLQLERVSDNVHNFVEVQVMKLATLLEQPMHVRAEKHERERRQKLEQASRQRLMREEQQKEADLLAKLHALEARAYEEIAPAMRLLSQGQGTPKELKRFERRKELQLLIMSPSELRERITSFEWSQMMTSGLEPQEVRALAHFLRLPAMPPQSAAFAEQVRHRILSFGDAEMAMQTGSQVVPRMGKRAMASSGPSPPPLAPPPVRASPQPPPTPPPPPPPPPILNGNVQSDAAPADSNGRSSAVPLNELQEAVRRRASASAVADPRAVREQQMREEKRRAMMRGKMASLSMSLSNRLRGGSGSTRGAAAASVDGQSPPEIVNESYQNEVEQVAAPEPLTEGGGSDDDDEGFEYV